MLRQKKKDARKAWKRKQAAYKTYKKKLRKAKFKAKLLPQISDLIGGDLLEGMADSDVGGGDEEGGGGEVVKEKGIQQIKELETMRYFLKSKVQDKIEGPIMEKLEAILEKIWGLLAKLKDSIVSSLVGAVGSIPFVGGLLSAVIPPTVGMAFEKIKEAVNEALGNVISGLIENIVGAIVDPIMDKISSTLTAGKFVRDLAELPDPDELRKKAKTKKEEHSANAKKKYRDKVGEAKAKKAKVNQNLVEAAEAEGRDEAKDEDDDLKAEVEALK